MERLELEAHIGLSYVLVRALQAREFNQLVRRALSLVFMGFHVRTWPRYGTMAAPAWTVAQGTSGHCREVHLESFQLRK
jgi:hypothetical protein